MDKIILLILLIGFATSCTDIKNKKAKVVVEKGTTLDADNPYVFLDIPVEIDSLKKEALGYWVGFFEATKFEPNLIEEVPNMHLMWMRENKINISIDEIKDSIVIGHSIIAGNNRPFEGRYNGTYFTVKEPGDDKYDGTFKFEIRDEKLIGVWSAYKDIEVKHRQYTLEKKYFEYDPNIRLERKSVYVDWSRIRTRVKMVNMDGELREWIEKEYSSATHKMYELNASNTRLKKEDVENLKRGDLVVIRNTIYARHGYSFKQRPLRIFFDRQDWYVPLSTDITKQFTEVEKENIKLLLAYEKNAKEYYDFFGR